MAEAPSPSSSSTTDSLCSDESFEEVFMKNESGDGEIILLPKTKAITPGKSARSSYTTDSGTQVPEEALNGDSVVGFFFNCLSSIGEETTIQRSSRGQKVLIVLAELKKGDPKYLADIAITLLSRVYSCIAAGKTYRLPSISQACVWRLFHQMRNSEGVRTLWKNFIALHTFPAAESNLTQLLLDQMLKAMLKNEAQASAVISSSTVPPLSPREKNAVRYMAGYVVISLLRKFKRPVKKPVLQEKYRIFITVLSQLKAEHQPTEIDSLSDYTRLWSELIDRGGLYHVSDKVSIVFFVN